MTDPQLIMFRDDDLGAPIEKTTIDFLYKKFNEVHEIYNKHGVIHEVGYVTGNQTDQKQIIDYVLSQKNIRIQFHAHTHRDFSGMKEKRLRNEFSNGVKIIEDTFGVTPTWWYPPFHRWSDMSSKIALEYGLQTSKSGIVSICDFLINPQIVFSSPEKHFVCHHYWEGKHTNKLDKILSMYKDFLVEKGH